jgi:hypothetical protein
MTNLLYNFYNKVSIKRCKPVQPKTQRDGPLELGQLIGAMEHGALSTSRSFLEEQTIPFPLLKGEPLLVQQHLRNATGFPAPATVQRHIPNLYETVLNPARHTVEYNHNLNRAQDSRTESDAKSMATQVVPLETDEKTSKPGRRSSKAREQEPEQVASTEAGGTCRNLRQMRLVSLQPVRQDSRRERTAPRRTNQYRARPWPLTAGDRQSALFIYQLGMLPDETAASHSISHKDNCTDDGKPWLADSAAPRAHLPEAGSAKVAAIDSDYW